MRLMLKVAKKHLGVWEGELRKWASAVVLKVGERREGEKECRGLLVRGWKWEEF